MTPPNRRTLLVVGLTLALLAAPALAQQEKATEKCFLWKIEAEGSTVYLLGSIHVGKDDAAPLDPAVLSAFEKSSILAVELDMSDPQTLARAQVAMAKQGLYPPGDDGLSRRLSKEERETAEKALQKEGLSLQALDRQRPWLASIVITLTLFRKAGFLPENGIDMRLLRDAKQARKKIVSLETVDEQLNALSSGSDELQKKMFLDLVKDLKAAQDQFAAMLKAWKSADPAALGEIIFKRAKEDPSLEPWFEALFYRRNEKMAAEIRKLLKEKGTTFVCVGAGHLVGKKSVLEFLEKEGLKPQQVEKAPK